MQNSGLLSSRRPLVRFFAQHWDAILASVLASVFLSFLTRHSGVGISPDSVQYITVAENIRWHSRIADFSGGAMVQFPAGYPIFLSICMLFTGMGVLQFAPVLNCFLFSGVLLLVSIIISRYDKPSRCYKLLFLFALVTSRCMLQVYSMLWSETLFIFLTLLFIVQLRSYLITYKPGTLLTLSLTVAVAFVIRYAGITLLAVGSLVLLTDGARSIRQKIKQLLLFNGIGISLVAINLIRNSRATGSLTGVRQEAERGLAANLADIGSTLSDWLPFLNGHLQTGMILFIVLVLVAAASLCYRILQQQFFRSCETIVSAFFLVYALFIVAVSTVSRFEQLNSRLLSPMYIPLLLVGSSWIPAMLQQWFYPKKVLFIVAVIAVYGGFQFHQYRQNAAAWEGIRDSGIPGYTEDDWTHSETIQFISHHRQDLGKVIFANANDAIYFLTRLHTQALPHKDIQKEVDKFLAYPSFAVIMFTDGDNPDLVNIEMISRHRQLLRKLQFSDGAIYYFGK